MFYAHFVLSKKGPLARIWLAAHWDKKLTKAHVFETNIDSSVDAILKPKVKLALRTSGHLLLGVVRIYSRKAKYLLADCNEAFVKIKMAFRPGVVDLPEENREAAVAAITLQENFHDFDTTLADLDDIDVQAQFSVNQSRPEEITMREDYAHIALVGDDGFGDVGFDDKEILRDASSFEDSLYKTDISVPQPDDKDNTLMNSTTDKTMDIDLEPPVMNNDFGDAVANVLLDADDDDDDDNDDNFGGDVDQEFFGDGLMEGGLFEETPMVDVSMPSEVTAEATEKDKEEAAKESVPAVAEPIQPPTPAAGPGEQTTLVHNEEEAFALEPLDITAVPGTERKVKRKRKLVVDELKGITSESIKLQLSDTSDIVTTLDLAPPTKKLMQWKETGGVEKLFALPGRSIISKYTSKLFKKNLQTKPVLNDEEYEQEKLNLDAPEAARDDDKHHETSYKPQDISTIVEEPSIVDNSRQSLPTMDKTFPDIASLDVSKNVGDLGNSTLVQDPVVGQEPNLDDVFGVSNGLVPLPQEPSLIQDPSLIQSDFEDPPSIAPFSVGPPSVGPESVGPPSVGPPSVGPPSVGPPSVPPPVFEDLEFNENDPMPETAEQEEKQWTKRTALMQQSLSVAYRYNSEISFKDMCRRHNRKQAASRFYTLLVLKKHQAIDVQQPEPFGDIVITKGPNFGVAC